MAVSNTGLGVSNPHAGVSNTGQCVSDTCLGVSNTRDGVSNSGLGVSNTHTGGSDGACSAVARRQPPPRGLRRDFRPISGRVSVTLSVETPLCPYGLPTVGS